MKRYWIIGVVLALSTGVYFYMQRPIMHEYCRKYSQSEWDRANAGDAEMRAEKWLGETEHFIQVRLRLPFRISPEDVIQITGNGRFLYEGSSPGDEILNLAIPVMPNDPSSLVYLRVVILRHSERMACVFENPEYIDLKDTPEGSEFLLEVLPRPYVREYDERETAVRQTRVR